MATRVNCIYQSGEKVAIQGCYEVAGAPQIQRSLKADEMFPCYDGRAVCWRLADNERLSGDTIQVVARRTVSAKSLARMSS